MHGEFIRNLLMFRLQCLKARQGVVHFRVYLKARNFIGRGVRTRRGTKLVLQNRVVIGPVLR